MLRLQTHHIPFLIHFRGVLLFCGLLVLVGCSQFLGGRGQSATGRGEAHRRLSDAASSQSLPKDIAFRTQAMQPPDWALMRASRLGRAEEGHTIGCLNRSFTWLGRICDDALPVETRGEFGDVCDLRIGISARSSETVEPQLVFLMDGRDGGCTEIGSLPTPGTHFSLTRDAKKLVVGFQNVVSLVDLPSLQEERRLERLPSDIQSLHVSPNDAIVLVGAGDGSIYRWSWDVVVHPSARIAGRYDLERYFSHANIVSAVRFHPSGRVFFSGDWNGNILATLGYEQDVHAGRFDRNIFGTGFFTEATPSQKIEGGDASRVDHLLIDKEKNFLFAAFDSGTVVGWKLRGLTRIAGFSPHRGVIREMTLSPAGTRVVTYGRDGRIVVNDIVSEFDEALGIMTYRSEVTAEWEIAAVSAMDLLDENTLLVSTKEGLRRMTIESGAASR
ncbi:MAG: WD40 repeat domain-containing protein [Bdellovibrionota bacterium]